MKRIVIALSLAMSLVLAFLGAAHAQTQTEHLKQARDHLNVIATPDPVADTDTFAQHARIALEHVKMAQERKASPDLEKAIQSLEDAMKQSQSGDAKKANEHAKEALEYIDAAKGALGG
jgi:hypothetical protein